MNTNLKASLLSLGFKPTALVLAVFLLGTAIFLPTLGYDFVWDDLALIKNNLLVKSLKNLPRLLVSNFPIAQDSFLYRPLVLVTFSLDYALFQENPWGFHLTNILLHGLNSALVALLAFLLLPKPWAAWVAGAFFALHPSHPEAVAFISGRTDLLATFFSLLALLFLVRENEESPGWGYWLWVPLFFFLALLSKETAAVLLLPMAFWLYQKSPQSQNKARATALKILPSAMMLGLFLLLRHLAMKTTSTANIKLKLYHSPLLLFKLFIRYLNFSFFPPQTVSFFYQRQSPVTWDFTFFLFLGLTVLFLAAMIYMGLRRRETVFSLALFILPCLPPLFYSLYMDAIMLERYLYLPSVGLAMLVSWGILQFPAKKKKWAFLAIGILLAAYMAATLWRTPPWKDHLTLFESFKKEYPSSPYIRGALGAAFMVRDRWSEAYGELSLALQLDPNDARHHSLYGQICLHIGLLEQARKEFNEALIRWPNYAVALDGLALSYAQEGNLEQALFYLDKAILADPKNEALLKNKQLLLSVKSSGQPTAQRKSP